MHNIYQEMDSFELELANSQFIVNGKNVLDFERGLPLVNLDIETDNQEIDYNKIYNIGTNSEGYSLVLTDTNDGDKVIFIDRDYNFHNHPLNLSGEGVTINKEDSRTYNLKGATAYLVYTKEDLDWKVIYDTHTEYFPLSGGVIEGNLGVNNVEVKGDLSIEGNLILKGDTETIREQQKVIEDKVIVLANIDNPSDVTADGGGIVLKGDTDKTILWRGYNKRWEFTDGISLEDSIYIKGIEVLTQDSLFGKKVPEGEFLDTFSPQLISNKTFNGAVIKEGFLLEGQEFRTHIRLTEGIEDNFISFPDSSGVVLLNSDIGVEVQRHSTILDKTTAAYTKDKDEKLANLEAQINILSTGLTYKGEWSPIDGQFPEVFEVNATYIITESGELNGHSFNKGDKLVSIVEEPSTTEYESNWSTLKDYSINKGPISSEDILDFEESVLSLLPLITTRDTLTVNVNYLNGILSADIKNNSVTKDHLDGNLVSVLDSISNKISYSDIDFTIQRKISGSIFNSGVIDKESLILWQDPQENNKLKTSSLESILEQVKPKSFVETIEDGYSHIKALGKGFVFDTEEFSFSKDSKTKMQSTILTNVNKKEIAFIEVMDYSLSKIELEVNLIEKGSDLGYLQDIKLAVSSDGQSIDIKKGRIFNTYVNDLNISKKNIDFVVDNERKGVIVYLKGLDNKEVKAKVKSEITYNSYL